MNTQVSRTKQKEREDKKHLVTVAFVVDSNVEHVGRRTRNLSSLIPIN